MAKETVNLSLVAVPMDDVKCGVSGDSSRNRLVIQLAKVRSKLFLICGAPVGKVLVAEDDALAFRYEQRQLVLCSVRQTRELHTRELRTHLRTYMLDRCILQQRSLVLVGAQSWVCEGEYRAGSEEGFFPAGKVLRVFGVLAVLYFWVRPVWEVDVVGDEFFGFKRVRCHVA